MSLGKCWFAPIIGRPATNTQLIMDSQAFFEKEVVAMGYSKDFQIVDFMAFIASSWEILPTRINAANLLALMSSCLICSCSFPSGDNQVPNVSLALVGSSLCSFVSISFSLRAYKLPWNFSIVLYLPFRFSQTKSIPYQNDLFLSTCRAPPVALRHASQIVRPS